MVSHLEAPPEDLCEDVADARPAVELVHLDAVRQRPLALHGVLEVRGVVGQDIEEDPPEVGSDHTQSRRESHVLSTLRQSLR